MPASFLIGFRLRRGVHSSHKGAGFFLNKKPLADPRAGYCNIRTRMPPANPRADNK